MENVNYYRGPVNKCANCINKRPCNNPEHNNVAVLQNIVMDKPKRKKNIKYKITKDDTLDWYHDYKKVYVENDIPSTIKNIVELFGINKLDKNGMSVLSHVSRYSQNNESLNLIRELVKNGAKVNIQNNDKWTPLMIASRHTKEGSNIDTVKTLLELKADPNIKNKDGDTCLQVSSKYAFNGSDKETVMLLINNNARI